LDQALALTCFMRQKAWPVALKIGVRRVPDRGIAAHAWIELDGLPVLEADTVQSDFVCFEPLPEGTLAQLQSGS
jgi:hypothetical protein